MSSRRRLVFSIGILSVIICAFLLVLARHSRQATYQGKSAAQWFKEFSRAKAQSFTIRGRIQSGGTNQVIYLLDAPRLERHPAAVALRALGTNAAVYLAEEICRRDPFWAPAYRTVWEKLPLGLRRIVAAAPAIRNSIQFEAADALNSMGPNAAAAAPILIRSLKDCDSDTFRTVMSVLRVIPFEQTHLDVPLRALADSGQLTKASRVVAELSVRTPTGARTLARARSSADGSSRQSAASQLEHFGPNAGVALVELQAALTDEDRELRYTAACALANLGTNARLAVPALVRATNDESVMVQHAAVRALRNIGSIPADATPSRQSIPAD